MSEHVREGRKGKFRYVEKVVKEEDRVGGWRAVRNGMREVWKLIVRVGERDQKVKCVSEGRDEIDVETVKGGEGPEPFLGLGSHAFWADFGRRERKAMIGSEMGRLIVKGVFFRVIKDGCEKAGGWIEGWIVIVAVEEVRVMWSAEVVERSIGDGDGDGGEGGREDIVVVLVLLRRG